MCWLENRFVKSTQRERLRKEPRDRSIIKRWLRVSIIRRRTRYGYQEPIRNADAVPPSLAVRFVRLVGDLPSFFLAWKETFQAFFILAAPKFILHSLLVGIKRGSRTFQPLSNRFLPRSEPSESSVVFKTSSLSQTWVKLNLLFHQNETPVFRCLHRPFGRCFGRQRLVQLRLVCQGNLCQYY